MIIKLRVAPHTGAWIEIMQTSTTERRKNVAPHTGAWIEITASAMVKVLQNVAPHTGAWIEMLKYEYSPVILKSLPTRERELKY